MEDKREDMGASQATGPSPDGSSQQVVSPVPASVPCAIRERLLATVGGMGSFKSSFSWRTFSPERRAEQAVVDGVIDANDGLAALSAAGATPDQAEEWLTGFVSRWAKYQHAGARVMNWMVTGPARFPVERNRKRMEVEHKRSVELSEYVNGAASWIARRNRAAERREAVAADMASGVVHKEKVVNGVRVILNKTLDRVQIIFPDKPSDDERAILKREAFRWAPSVGAWQRQLTQNGVWAAERVLGKIAASAIETRQGGNEVPSSDESAARQGDAQSTAISEFLEGEGK